MSTNNDLKRNTSLEILPQGFSSELNDWKEVAVNEDGLQKVEVNGNSSPLLIEQISVNTPIASNGGIAKIEIKPDIGYKGKVVHLGLRYNPPEGATVGNQRFIISNFDLSMENCLMDAEFKHDSLIVIKNGMFAGDESGIISIEPVADKSLQLGLFSGMTVGRENPLIITYFNNTDAEQNGLMKITCIIDQEKVF